MKNPQEMSRKAKVNTQVTTRKASTTQQLLHRLRIADVTMDMTTEFLDNHPHKAITHTVFSDRGDI